MLPYTEAIFKPWEIERILKALAKDDAKKELERKMLDAKKKARVIANRKAYLKRQKAKKEKAEKEKAEKAQREKEQEELRKKLAQ